MAILEPLSVECTSHSEEQTQRLGSRLGALLPRHAVVAIQGELGAGKTSFARGIGEGWGAEQVLRSPTFTIIQEHRRPSDGAVLYHIDLYRVAQEEDLRNLGLEEILDAEDGVVLIEWPERAAELIPPEAIHVKITPLSETKRHLVFSTQDTHTWQILLEFRKRTFGF
ncbi:MAG: tRNA (adenosine(37)-N6)-threonylcarbamoyltransferase complex ATPase subunit type 1 TsaE [Thermoflexales bacterium]|nr:tRNA (adenosine(37)-N6)-threonylcarbamoyltransferase complex ATPase subunit type 1 TsaE [Thermoflexales bacterium]MCS7325652.1 tRNA (adenosine(37)-N6)-threonylcarbamoyltransferase complex ATPase subunit type 1 TsaE [Thermoflexales bacterium]MDW8054099.1 tRNA (adenosine(37)-N6)-threonylcarbamoyltransferase complex ATPase subunit type 1 TsaE [Anaerolineae bacterium]